MCFNSLNRAATSHSGCTVILCRSKIRESCSRFGKKPGYYLRQGSRIRIGLEFSSLSCKSEFSNRSSRIITVEYTSIVHGSKISRNFAVHGQFPTILFLETYHLIINLLSSNLSRKLKSVDELFTTEFLNN